MRTSSVDYQTLGEISPRQTRPPSLSPTATDKDPPTPGTSDQPCQPLLSYSDVPDWYKDNPFIRHGYRPVSNSTPACLASLFYLHNETVNIYSHLIPAALFCLADGVVIYYFQTKYPDTSAADYLVFTFFLLTAFLCLGISAAFHTLMNHSEEVCHAWLQLDFIGILILTLGDFISGIYMIFHCEPDLKRKYWTMIFTLSCLSIFLLVNPRFQGPRWRTFRLGTFVGTGLSGIVPLIHGIRLFGMDQMVKQSGIVYYLVEGSLLLLGALFYTIRAPERLKPGSFDIVGSSHQIFHVLVVLATAVHFIGILLAFDYNYHHRVCKLS